MSRVTRSAAERSDILEAYKASGLSVADFAATANIRPATLYQWVTRSKSKIKEGAPQVRVARVVRRPSKIEDVPPKPPIVVKVGRVKVEVEAGFDPTTLSAVLELLNAQVARGALQ